MGTKSILLAIADASTLAEITEALTSDWEVTPAGTEADARAQLENPSFNALLVDFNLGSPDASELLNYALEKSPGTARFLLAYEADLALVAAKVLGSPQILPKPVESASLKSRIESGINASSPQSGNESTPVASEAPKIPPIYAEVLEALKSPNATNKRIGKIIARDEELKSQLLSLTNSSYQGLPNNIKEPAEAVASLGFEVVKALVTALQFLAEHSQVKRGYLSLERIWQHSTTVAKIARDLILFETKDRNLASQALIAGLLHDLGKVVLATNFDDLYGRVHSLARKQPVALWDVEKEMFGANHGEIGACLIGMWNLPGAIVEAAASHHEPPVGETHELTPLAAVHIANILEHELRPDDEELMVAPVINTPYVNDLGLLQRLPVWRATFGSRTSSKFDEEAELVGRAEPEMKVRPNVRTLRRATPNLRSEQETPGMNAAHQRRPWLYASAAGAVLVLSALWLMNQAELSKPEPVYARIPAIEQTPVGVASLLQPTPAVIAPAPEASPIPEKPATSVAATETAPNAESTRAVPETTQKPVEAVKPVESLPAPVSSLNASNRSEVTASQGSVTNLPGPAPAAKPIPEFRVYGIIFSSVPYAIVNHRSVTVGDRVDGATVIEIGRTAVTLQVNGQRKTYELR